MPTLPRRAKARSQPEQQYLVMASEPPLRSHRTLPPFMRLTWDVVRQLERTQGLVGYAIDARPFAETFRTLSVWRSEEHLDAFARGLPHTNVIRKLRGRMDLTTFVTWHVPGTSLPISSEDARATIDTAAAGTATGTSG